MYVEVREQSSVSVFAYHLLGEHASLIAPHYVQKANLTTRFQQFSCLCHQPCQGPLELQTHNIAPGFARVLGIQTLVLTLAWQMLSTPSHLPRPQSVIKKPLNIHTLLTVSFLPEEVCSIS